MQGIHCFEKGSVVGGLKSRDKFAAIRELIHKSQVLSRLENPHRVEKAAIKREKLYTTGLGEGIAIAHGKTEEVKELNVVLGISPNGINFDALDGKPVHLLFLIANPPHRENEYLLVLSALARLLRDKNICTFLKTNRDYQKIEKKMFTAFQRCLKQAC
jgi:PTS system nitrogen regulatory IIA component